MRPIRLPPEFRLTRPEEEEALLEKIAAARECVPHEIPPLLNLRDAPAHFIESEAQHSPSR